MLGMSMENPLDPGRRLVQKGFVEEWVFISGESSYGQNVMAFPAPHHRSR